jgi:hypothetical protein
MKFMMTFSLDPATRNEAIDRFLKTGEQHDSSDSKSLVSLEGLSGRFPRLSMED